MIEIQHVFDAEVFLHCQMISHGTSLFLDSSTLYSLQVFSAPLSEEDRNAFEDELSRDILNIPFTSDAWN